jgi:hypothetical protein
MCDSESRKREQIRVAERNVEASKEDEINGGRKKAGCLKGQGDAKASGSANSDP